ncbi:MAG: conjugal transfer protein TraO [Methylomonas lenta]|nr:conjugal transfer protein TraO [Methylomonas lenta]
MKQRLLVMNGQRIVQGEQEIGQWQNEKVEKANGVKPGLYNLYTSIQADKNKAYTGLILHSDKNNVFQQIGKNNFVTHSRTDFSKVPDVGLLKNISYDNQGKAVVVDAESIKLNQGLSR